MPRRTFYRDEENPYDYTPQTSTTTEYRDEEKAAESTVSQVVEAGSLANANVKVMGDVVNITEITKDVGGWDMTKSTLKTQGMTLDAGKKRITVGDGSTTDIIIDGLNGYIQSLNYVADTSGFWIASDKIEANNLIARTTGEIGGWNINPTTLDSAATGARISLDKTNNRIEVYDATNEKVAMGYLGGLPKNDGTGNWTTNDYGFWARSGDELAIDGDVDYVNGDWLVQNDASLLIKDGSDNTIIRLGTDTLEKGLFIYDTSGTVLAKFISNRIFIGDATYYLDWDGTTLTISGVLDESKIIYTNTFGDGSDGDVTISANTTLTSNMYYNNLTISNGYTLTTAGYLVFVKGTLTNNGTIDWSGNDGNDGGDGDPVDNTNPTDPGAGGTGGAALTDGFLTGSPAGKDGAIGGEGGANTPGGNNGGNGTAGANIEHVLADSIGVLTGIAGKAGGDEGATATGGTGGGAGTMTRSGTQPIAQSDYAIMRDFTDLSKITYSGNHGGAGGGAGAGHNIASGQGAGGGGGGGAGSNGGAIIIFARTLTNSVTGVISSNGGDGGDGGDGGAGSGTYPGAGGGGGGNGGNGGVIILYSVTLTNNGSITYAGGTGGAAGAGGAGTPSGDAGTAGGNGNSGYLLTL